MVKEPLIILSLGGGVQSSTLLLMSLYGVLPLIDAAIFADTQWESRKTYDHLEWLKSKAEDHGVKIIQATKGSIKEDALRSRVRGRVSEGSRWASIPYFTLGPNGERGMIRRQCTQEYKIEVIQKEVRKLVGLKPRQRLTGDHKISVQQWIGISADEASRMKDSRVSWIKNHYPLISDFAPAMDRADCINWLIDHHYPIPPKSSCLGCPFHSDREWREIKSNPEEWSDVVAFDKAIRNYNGRARNYEGMIGEIFLHASRKPLDEVDFSTLEDRGQRNWINECEGMCGV